MEIVVSAIAVVVAAGCFLAVVASDMRDRKEREQLAREPRRHPNP